MDTKKFRFRELCQWHRFVNCLVENFSQKEQERAQLLNSKCKKGDELCNACSTRQKSTKGYLLYMF